MYAIIDEKSKGVKAKMIGIIGTMEEEIIAIKRQMQVVAIEEKAEMLFYKGMLGVEEIVLVKCATTIVSATVCTQILIDTFKVEKIISVGIAAGLCPQMNVGDIVVATDTQTHRQKEMNKKEQQKLIDCSKACAENQQIFVGEIKSEDAFSAHIKAIGEIVGIYVTYCSEIEGAAISHCCYLNHIPFVMIRIISDNATQNIENNYYDFVDQAGRQVSKLLTMFMNDKV